ncbi:hypothetical protein EDD37DRAFT_619930 [Exophiala viscosa]|uniref:Uncharacterized protein n=1 Tax=Exophiala viscosa TaxID=2486360 RepID=A0AAN6IHA2_9EURO|nr:hypothetical protein EDD36DRAFT_837 [Exophiala viscosa]KAI1626561.1 hypothetical protein EDD37DRAFT_619930 [Exophiala viscosa]
MPNFPPFKDIRGPAVNGLRARFCPVLRPRTIDEREIRDWFNPKIHALRDKYSKVSSDTLEWCVVAATSQKKVPKAVMRNRLRRRWANAFADSLRSNGFHFNGRSQAGPKDGTDARPGLTGTLELCVYSPNGLTVPYHELLRSTNMIVKTLKQASRRPSQVPRPAPVRFWTEKSRDEAKPASKTAWSFVHGY